MHVQVNVFSCEWLRDMAKIFEMACYFLTAHSQQGFQQFPRKYRKMLTGTLESWQMYEDVRCIKANVPNILAEKMEKICNTFLESRVLEENTHLEMREKYRNEKEF